MKQVADMKFNAAPVLVCGALWLALQPRPFQENLTLCYTQKELLKLYATQNSAQVNSYQTKPTFLLLLSAFKLFFGGT